MTDEDAGVARLVNTLDPVTPLWYELEIDHNGHLSRPVPPEVRLWTLTQVSSEYAVVTAFRGIRAGLLLVDLVKASWRWLTPDDAASYSLVESSKVGGAASLRIARTALDGSVTDWTWSGDEQALRPVGSAQQSPAQLTVELRRWSVPGGTMEGLLTLPPRTHRSLPLVVDLHGGPLPGLRAGDLGNGAGWCERGYAHFRPEFRSSGILGRQAMWDQTRGQGLPDYDLEIDDVLLGTRQVVTDSRIDDSRIVLIGFSYGGYLANRIATQPNPFAAIISWEGIADPRRLDRTSVAIQSRWRGGSPSAVPERWAAAAPVVRAAQVRVPMLLVYGARSRTLEHGRIWFSALQQASIRKTMITIAGQEHVFTHSGIAEVIARCHDWIIEVL